MDRTERFYRIDQRLHASPGASFARLLEELGVSRAQLKRDLAYMRDRLNAPIEFDRDAGGYRYGEPQDGPRYELPGLWFSADEVHALLTMQHLLVNLEPGLLTPHVKPLLQRLSAILGSRDGAKDEVGRRVRVIPLQARRSNVEQFSVVARAVLKRRRLTVDHYNRAEDRRTTRTLSPQRLVHYRDNWYLDAYCHLREGLRSFSVDAFEAARLTDDPAREVPDAELDAFLKSGYGIFTGRDVEWAKLRFSPTAARWVARQTWHGKQRGTGKDDGSYVLELPYADDRELVGDILRFGSDVEVLAPPALRDRVAAELAKAAQRYR